MGDRWERSITTLLRNGNEAVAEFRDWRVAEDVRQKLAAFDFMVVALEQIAQLQREKAERADAETLFVILSIKVDLASTALAKAQGRTA